MAGPEKKHGGLRQVPGAGRGPGGPHCGLREATVPRLPCAPLHGPRRGVGLLGHGWEGWPGMPPSFPGVPSTWTSTQLQPPEDRPHPPPRGALAMNRQGINRDNSRLTGMYSRPPQCKLLGHIYVVQAWAQSPAQLREVTPCHTSHVRSSWIPPRGGDCGSGKGTGGRGRVGDRDQRAAKGEKRASTTTEHSTRLFLELQLRIPAHPWLGHTSGQWWPQTPGSEPRTLPNPLA